MRRRIFSYAFMAMSVVAALALCSCASPKKIVYFQDLRQGVSENAVTPKKIKVRSGDKISIIVKSKDPELAALFNLPAVTYSVDAGKMSSLGGQNQRISSYTVDTGGDIDFPVLGKLHVEEMLREEIARMVKDRLVSGNYVNDPVVTVEFDNLRYSVIGEVKTPGQYLIDRDQVTVLDAIGRAGDLTIYGRRDGVVVLRREEGRQVAYKLDLCSAATLAESPAYYLQQDDIVYVEPNNTRARQSTLNGNTVFSSSFWLSIASLLTSVSLIFVK